MTEQALIPEQKWTYLQKFLFLFICIYTVVYFIPLDDMLPTAANPLARVTLWIGGHVVHLKHFTKIEETGSGDTRYNYIQLITNFLFSSFVAFVIFLVDRKRNDYRKLRYWLFLVIRYALGFYMVVYGLAKVFKSQFPFPFLDRLEQPFGESSPMGLLWTFMGYSLSYNIFSGLGEIAGGVLVFFRRTTALGSLLIIGVMSNVLMMNMSYDVPVKLFSAHLILFALILLFPNIKALYNFFIGNKEAALTNYPMPPYKKWVRITSLVLRSIIIVGGIGVPGYFSYAEMAEDGDFAPKPPLYGIYKTEVYLKNNDTIPPLMTDSVRWKRLIIDTGGEYALFNTMTDKRIYYLSKVDSVKKSIVLKSYTDSTEVNHFSYIEMKDHLVLNGKIKADSIHVQFKKTDLNKYLLVSRGFHWVNEYPYNR